MRRVTSLAHAVTIFCLAASSAHASQYKFATVGVVERPVAVTAPAPQLPAVAMQSPAGVRAPGAAKTFELAFNNLTWRAQIDLPRSDNDGDRVIVKSFASMPVRIQGPGLLYDRAYPLGNGELYVFEFRADLGKWYPIKTPESVLTAQDLVRGAIPVPSKPQTTVSLADNNWTQTLILPKSGLDRDRITIRSASSYSADIANENTSFTGTMKVVAGQAYEFMFDAGKQRWMLLDAPRTVVDAKTATIEYQAIGQSIDGLRTPDPRTPVTELVFSESSLRTGNRLHVLRPKNAKPGDRLIVKNNSKTYVVVNLGSGVMRILPPGYENVDEWTGSKWWNIVQSNVGVLQLYSTDLANKIGKDIVLVKLAESLRLTNEALEKSGANFRIYSTGVSEVDSGSRSGGSETYWWLHDSANVRNLRDQTKADVVYFLGDIDHCSSGVFKPAADWAFAMGSGIKCGPEAMRQAIGAVMGADVLSSKGKLFASGTIADGNRIGFYAGVNGYDPVTGLPLGAAGVFDSIGPMNIQSSNVSDYR